MLSDAFDSDPWCSFDIFGLHGLDVKRRADGIADCILLDDVVGDELVEGT